MKKAMNIMISIIILAVTIGLLAFNASKKDDANQENRQRKNFKRKYITIKTNEW